MSTHCLYLTNNVWTHNVIERWREREGERDGGVIVAICVMARYSAGYINLVIRILTLLYDMVHEQVFVLFIM